MHHTHCVEWILSPFYFIYKHTYIYTLATDVIPWYTFPLISTSYDSMTSWIAAPTSQSRTSIPASYTITRLSVTWYYVDGDSWLPELVKAVAVSIYNTTQRKFLHMLFLMSKKELKRYKNSKLKKFRCSKRQCPLKEKTEITEAENNT